MEQQNELVVFADNESPKPIGFTFDGTTLWATQEQIATVFGTSVQNVSQHIKNIYAEGELLRGSTLKKFFNAVDKPANQQIQHYSLDVVISVGYRVNSKRATKFRQWATRELTGRIMGAFKGGGLTKDEQRVAISDRVSLENIELLHSARAMGVTDDVAFYNAGYQGMYGMRMQEIKRKKGLGTDRLLDRAGITELAANQFRITQASALLKDLKAEDGLMVGQTVALQTHWQVGQHVRQAIGNIGGEMPEDLPAEPDHISEVRKRVLTSKVRPKEIGSEETK